MWKKIITAAAMIIVAFVFQTTLFQWLAIGNISPNLIIMVIFILGFIGGPRTGMLVGMLSGLIIDCYYSDLFGMNALILLFIGYLNGLFGKMFYDDDIKVPALLLIASDFIYNLLYYFIWFLLNGKFDFSYYLIKIIIPEVVYTFIITVILYIPLTRLVKKIFIGQEKRSTEDFVKKY